MYKIHNNAINDKTIIEMFTNRDKEYSNRILQQLIRIVKSTYYIEKEEFIEDCFTLLNIGIEFNTPSNYFTLLNFIVYMNSKFGDDVSDEFEEVKFNQYINTNMKLTQMIRQDENNRNIDNLKEYKNKLSIYFRKQHIKFTNMEG